MAKVKLTPVYKKPVEDIPVKTEFIKLESFLKLAGAAPTGGMAKTVIQQGAVKVNGIVCNQRSRKLRSGDVATFWDRSWRVAAETGTE